MSKKDKGRPYPSRDFHDAVCGKVKISFNRENEVKTALVAHGSFAGREDTVADTLWRAYVREKTAEWFRSFDQHVIRRASGKKLRTPLHAETKPFRRRTFQTVVSGHPANVEIRIEDLVTMIKVAEEKTGDPRILNRMEIRIDQQLPGQIALDEIPGPLGKYVARHFNGTRRRFPGVMTESWRDKITVPIRFEWEGEAIVVDYERAKDIGVSTSLAGHKRDITEFEGEVKKVYSFDSYMRGQKVDIREFPERIGWTSDNVARMIEGFLSARLDNFIGFANDWLELRKYRGCTIVPVTHSKSQPEMDALHALLLEGDKTARTATRQAIRHVTASGQFAVDPTLNALRREMKAAPHLP